MSIHRLFRRGGEFTQRNAMKRLASWIDAKVRNPLLTRGAGQAGKSTLVHLFAERSQRRRFRWNWCRRGNANGPASTRTRHGCSRYPKRVQTATTSSRSRCCHCRSTWSSRPPALAGPRRRRQLMTWEARCAGARGRQEGPGHRLDRVGRHRPAQGERRPHGRPRDPRHDQAAEIGQDEGDQVVVATVAAVDAGAIDGAAAGRRLCRRLTRGPGPRTGGSRARSGAAAWRPPVAGDRRRREAVLPTDGCAGATITRA